jgi:hypothetical protein
LSVFKISFLIWVGTVLIAPNPSYSMSPKVKTVLVFGGGGALAGTLLGLLTLPFSSNARGVFMGSSIGLYLGLAGGTALALNGTPGLTEQFFIQSRPSIVDLYAHHETKATLSLLQVEF